VGISSACYAGWVRGRRGHLMHWDRLAGFGGKCRRGRVGRGGVDGGRRQGELWRRVGGSLSLRGVAGG
jgi:hypothetical protein